MEGKIYVGDIGTEIFADVGIAIDGAPTTDIVVRKPDGAEVTWTGEVSDGDLGGDNQYVKYTTILDDLDQSGVYLCQAHVVTASGWDGLGETFQLVIHSAYR